ncbi:hypothetical protein EDEG_01271 [Edhazardia aedis USNM 41457]|uniref:Uncharacterized protein n=1 Tax=Edhazardia aedis (strain USNM 41457) TaxID=1003232 RepID=J8ZXU7_EDHAE|nr:hypothetical protein EDEG_01271 [Edhazardia aedis USNM 41457]|eukprot:EJW04503.1 hypothetical protein EDEG_01271 [Edhazardia aedis USNM 41457]
MDVDTEKIKEALSMDNCDELLKSLEFEIKRSESDLQEYILNNKAEIIEKCGQLSRLNLKNIDINEITLKLTNYVLNANKKLEEEQNISELLNKTREVENECRNILQILKSIDSKPQKLVDYFFCVKNLNEAFTLIKRFKKYSFYNVLKALLNSKKSEILICAKNEMNEWISYIMSKYTEFGEKLIQNRSVHRKELNLPQIMVAFYVHEMLNQSDEFLTVFNAKRQNISQQLRFWPAVGFLYVEKILNEKLYKFFTIFTKTSFEKNELVKIIYFMKDFDFDPIKQEDELSKLCCDFIISEKMKVKKASDVDLFYESCSAYLNGVELPSVYEFFYSCIDTFYCKFFDDVNVEVLTDKLIKIRSLSLACEYQFKLDNKIHQYIEKQNETLKK